MQRKMYIIVGAIVQLAITSRVMALSLHGFLKTLPDNMPEDLKTIIKNLQEKHPQEFGIDSSTPTSTNFESVPLAYAGANFLNATFMKLESINPTSQDDTLKSNFLRKEETPVVSSTYGSEQAEKKVSTLSTQKPSSELHNVECLTPKTSLPQIPVPIMPIGIPVYPQMPIIVPARTYYEPVKHDHPPLYKIREMIDADEKKWREEDKKHGCHDDNGSLEVAYSDDSSSSTDTESRALSVDVGSEYYDGFIKISVK